MNSFLSLGVMVPGRTRLIVGVWKPERSMQIVAYGSHDDFGLRLCSASLKRRKYLLMKHRGVESS